MAVFLMNQNQYTEEMLEILMSNKDDTTQHISSVFPTESSTPVFTCGINQFTPSTTVIPGHCFKTATPNRFNGDDSQ
ncbi:hypothetical protein PRIPAC_79273 [Pristionchus pacificus]|uniref:Uncharacterized protein n=1 Tax=Pristionchus pacificus TaxID=54126 RepID=A0A2A6CBC6_PRIPA|nr:hypothetical protein PRIPAC_79273 [Pristionchus pacificus]|eukprot:PDM75474.1 hypothetical protein PRIPAC_42651 [Pristionchus pacificus]